MYVIATVRQKWKEFLISTTAHFLERLRGRRHLQWKILLVLFWNENKPIFRFLHCVSMLTYFHATWWEKSRNWEKSLHRHVLTKCEWLLFNNLPILKAYVLFTLHVSMNCHQAHVFCQFLCTAKEHHARKYW